MSERRGSPKPRIDEGSADEIVTPIVIESGMTIGQEARERWHQFETEHQCIAGLRVIRQLILAERQRDRAEQLIKSVKEAVDAGIEAIQNGDGRHAINRLWYAKTDLAKHCGLLPKEK